MQALSRGGFEHRYQRGVHLLSMRSLAHTGAGKVRLRDGWAEKVRAYLKAELKRASVTYGELAEHLSKHGLKGETDASIKNKLARGTFAATFLLATLAALEMDGVRLEDV
jgi:hypothetical protein